MIYINHLKVEVEKFPCGELKVQIDKNSLDFDSYRYVKDDRKYIYIKAIIKNSDDIMTLLLVHGALTSIGFEWIRLIIPYFPYARQDRICNYGEPLSVLVMCNLLKTMHFEKIYIFDPHSDVLPALLDGICEVSTFRKLIFEDFDWLLEGKTIICPDAGAEKRTRSLGLPYIMATKNRDTKTGEITGTTVYCDSLEGQDCLIVDDLCDGGRTFIELAKVLREKGAKTVSLYVTHGMFTKGKEIFNGILDGVYCYFDYTKENMQ